MISLPSGSLAERRFSQSGRQRSRRSCGRCRSRHRFQSVHRPALESLSHSIGLTIASIRAALPADSSPAGAPSLNVDPSTVAQPLSQLKKLLETDDGDASDFLLEARPVLSQVLTSPEIDSLSAHIGNFAYSDALRTVSEIAARLSLRLE